MSPAYTIGPFIALRPSKPLTGNPFAWFLCVDFSWAVYFSLRGRDLKPSEEQARYLLMYVHETADSEELSSLEPPSQPAPSRAPTSIWAAP
jgi:hypothetical protein